MLVVDTRERCLFASKEIAFYFQPESFSGGLLLAKKEPFHTAKRVTWDIAGELSRFKPVSAAWMEPAHEANAADAASPLR